MKCTLIGVGCGPSHLTKAAQEALREAQLMVGARRLLALVPNTGAKKIAEYRPQAIADLLKAHPVESCCVLYSGDSGL